MKRCAICGEIVDDSVTVCPVCKATKFIPIDDSAEIKFACVDGPDFDGHLVNYDELMNRNAAYKAQEEENKKTHICRMTQLANELIK